MPVLWAYEDGVLVWLGQVHNTRWIWTDSQITDIHLVVFSWTFFSHSIKIFISVISEWIDNDVRLLEYCISDCIMCKNAYQFFFRFNYLSTVLWYVLKSRSHAKSLSSGYSHVHLISISHLQRDIHKLMVVRFLLLGAWTFKMYSIFVQCYETFIMYQIDWRFIQFLLYIFYF